LHIPEPLSITRAAISSRKAGLAIHHVCDNGGGAKQFFIGWDNFITKKYNRGIFKKKQRKKKEDTTSKQNQKIKPATPPMPLPLSNAVNSGHG